MAPASVKLRTIVFFVGWTTVTLVIGVLGLPSVISRRAVWKLCFVWNSFTLWWLKVTCGITSSVEGIEHVKPGMLIASKHQSAWDTIMLWCVLKNPVFVLKRELYFIPIFGWYLWRSGQIAINREDKQGALQRVTWGTERYAKQGRSLIMFPEGTRIAPGTHGTFRPGIARVSAALKLPVAPVALNAGYFWPKRPIWKTPGHAVLQFLPPIEACGDDTNSWMKDLEARIIGASDAIARREYK